MHSRLFEGNVHVAVMLFVPIEYTLMEEDEVIIADSPAPGTVPTVTPRMSVFPSTIFVGGDTSILRGYEDNHDHTVWQQTLQKQTSLIHTRNAS